MTLPNTNDNVDVYRDTLVRYLGYSNEVGEAFRSLVKKQLVHASYAVAIGYVLCDTVDKAKKKHKLPEALGGGTRGALVASGDTLIWQMLASVAIPGFTINRICWGTRMILKKTKAAKAGKWISTIVGLASIPLIIHPIDRGVDQLMDNTYRKYVS
ncbi:mitochondrial fission process protein 1 [Culicoides brevitarsis]|uniref:mitochondrial fission process protein 1 n=1 Tax=Culicoides brevitarsis TaxID=469753 RepID=UPI00307BC0DC